MTTHDDPRDPRVSAAALLGRPTEVTHPSAVSELVRGRRVLVTGAGGSIGSELARQLHRLGAERVFLLDHDESALHTLMLELRGHGLLDDDTTVLADIRDRARLTRTFRRLRPDLVFHAAAHKHLPLLERYPAEAVKTNVFGTRNVVEAAIDCGAGHVINVSTDKAARPTSVLGASKRLAEDIVRHAGSASDTSVASVRFGNVLGSRGSFLPSLMWQVDNRRDVTVTDAEVSRFFMTIPEAAGLVIESATMARTGETYVLDMGEPVRIVDLVHRYAVLGGFDAPNIVFTGLRPGEKLHEELFDTAELCETTTNPGIWVIRPRTDDANVVVDALTELDLRLATGADDAALRDLLLDSVAQSAPSAVGVA
jgi:FlaA1/EpsC-like NDP-sugar epimerase